MKNIDKFFGSTVLGKKGQVVIPMETRKKMGWKEGEKILVFGLENGTVVLAKLGHLKAIANQLENKLKKIKKIIK